MPLCRKFGEFILFFFAKLYDCLLFKTIASAFIKVMFLKLFFQWKASRKPTGEQKILAKDRKYQLHMQ